MSANFENKKVVVSEIEEYAKNAKSIVLVDYRGVTVSQATELRDTVRAAGGTYKVYKNRLMKIAFELNFQQVIMKAQLLCCFMKLTKLLLLKLHLMAQRNMVL